MKPSTKLSLGAALALAAVSAIAGWPRDPVNERASSASEVPARSEAPAASTPIGLRVARRAAAPEEGPRVTDDHARAANEAERDPVSALAAALEAGDDVKNVEAIEAVVAARATNALPLLVKVRLPDAPHTAPTVIAAIATLGNELPPRERREPALTLVKWLHDESRRDGRDAAGNTSVLIDALADTKQREAIEALAAVLDDEVLPLHQETLAVQRLAELGSPLARRPIERFAARVEAMTPKEDDEGLRREALSAARDALARLGG